MSGWLIGVIYEVSGGSPTHEALFASWLPDREEALRQVIAYEPRGSHIPPRIIAEVPDHSLRGLKLSPGETGLLCAETVKP